MKTKDDALIMTVLFAAIMFVVCCLDGCATLPRPMEGTCPIPDPPRDFLLCSTTANQQEFCCSYMDEKDRKTHVMCQVIRDNKCPSRWEEQ